MFAFSTRVISIALAIGIVMPLLAEPAMKVIPSPTGIYHGAFPDFFEGTALGVRSKILDLENAIGKNLAVVTYNNDWVDGAVFPWDAIDQFSSVHRVPLIRILPRSRRQQSFGVDPVYNLASFLRGDHDAALRQWARNAKLASTPLMVEFAPEANGRWYPWNGVWNGGEVTTAYGDPALADGPERYRDVYRRVVDLFRLEGVTNVSFVFHVDSQPKPVESWNSMAAYYPGDTYIDWLGISVFGAQYPWDYWSSFTEVLDAAYPEFAAITPNKPLVISEFGVIEDEFDNNRKTNWISDALNSLTQGRYPRIKMVSYWNESSWIPGGKNNLRLDSSPQALHTYQTLIANPIFLPSVDLGEN